MSSVALDMGAGYLSGRGSPPAGQAGENVLRIATRAFGDLKNGVTAGNSWVFNDLHALAAENSCEVQEDAAFALAQRFLLALPGHMPAPELSIDEDGEIAFDWRGDGSRLFHVTLRKDGRLSYACWLSLVDREHGIKVFVDAIPKAIVDCIQAVAGK